MYATYVVTVLHRVSPERDGDSIHDDDDLSTDQQAGQLHQEQEMEEPTANNEQSTEQQQQQQQQEEEEERECMLQFSKHINTLMYKLLNSNLKTCPQLKNITQNFPTKVELIHYSHLQCFWYR